MAKPRTESVQPGEGDPPNHDLIPSSVDASAELAALKARIEAVKAAGELPGFDYHCRDCFRRGQAAAIAAILDTA